MSHTQELKNRIQDIVASMKANDLDALIGGANSQPTARGILRYYFNYRLPIFEEYFVITKESEVLFLCHDNSGLKHAAHSPVISELVQYKNPAQDIVHWIKKRKLKNIGLINLSGVSANFYHELSTALSYKDYSHLYNRQRMIKSTYELELTKKCIESNEKSIDFYTSALALGKNDREVYLEARRQTESLAPEEQYWVLGFPNLGYAFQTGHTPHTFVSGDLVTVYAEHAFDGVWGETIQLYSFGEPTDEVKEAYALLAVIQRSFETLPPASPVSNFVKTCQNILDGSGFNTQITGAIGHAQGYDIIEDPILTSDNNLQLAPGMRFSVHPSITLSDGRKLSMGSQYFISTDKVLRLDKLRENIIII